jgi:hypothetical protein
VIYERPRYVATSGFPSGCLTPASQAVVGREPPQSVRAYKTRGTVGTIGVHEVCLVTSLVCGSTHVGVGSDPGNP